MSKRRGASISLRELPEWLQTSVKAGNEVARLAAGLPVAGKPAKKARPKDDEFEAQAEFFRLVFEDPELEPLPIYAVPNFAGHYGSRGQRMASGARAKQAGRRKGIPDVAVDVPVAGVPGLRFEFKVKGKQPDPDQKVWHERYRALGFAVVVVVTPLDALEVLRDYLAGGEEARLRSAAQRARARAQKRPDE